MNVRVRGDGGARFEIYDRMIVKNKKQTPGAAKRLSSADGSWWILVCFGCAVTIVVLETGVGCLVPVRRQNSKTPNHQPFASSLLVAS